MKKAYNHCNADYVKEIKEELGDRGFDITLEMPANVNLPTISLCSAEVDGFR